jgi:adenylate kinase
MRVLFMGQTGIDKTGHLEKLRELRTRKGKNIGAVFNIGDMIYEESEKAGRFLQERKILDIPLADLAYLKRQAFRRLSYDSADMENVFVNSHAVFRWNNQLFRAFELPELEGFSPDVIVLR